MTNKDLEDRIKKNLSEYYKCEGRNKSWYYIPELDEWVNKFNNELKALGYTQRYWYNKMILEIDDHEFKPTCQLDGCSNQVGNFKGVKYGYPSYCCNSHRMKTDEAISRFKAVTNTRAALDKKSNSLKMIARTPEYKTMRSTVSKSLWNDPEYRSRNLSKIPRGNCVSKISNECMSNLDKIFRLFGWGSGLFGDNEKVVFTGSKFNDIKNYRKLDYYHEQFNFVIEFQGDHWHPRDESKDDPAKIAESIDNDMSKFNSVKSALCTDNYFYVYEKDYKSNKDQVVHELVEDIFYSIESY